MKSSIYQQIHEIIRLIPAGKVATYGQIAEIVGGCTARMVGYATSAIPFNSARLFAKRADIARRFLFRSIELFFAIRLSLFSA